MQNLLIAIVQNTAFSNNSQAPQQIKQRWVGGIAWVLCSWLPHYSPLGLALRRCKVLLH